MAGRHKQFVESEVLEKAMNVFWMKGYEATSTEDLLVAMELNKGSLYNTFNSKKDLFVRVVDYFGDFLLQHVETVIRSQENPIAGIRYLFENICNDSAKDRERGCFLGNSISELSNIDQDMEKKAIARLKQMENLFIKYLDEGKAAGHLAPDADTGLIALHLVNLWNGLYVTLRMYSMKDLEKVIKMNLEIMK